MRNNGKEQVTCTTQTDQKMTCARSYYILFDCLQGLDGMLRKTGWLEARIINKAWRPTRVSDQGGENKIKLLE